MKPDQPPPRADGLPEFLEAFDDAIVAGQATQDFFAEAESKFGGGAAEFLQTIELLRNVTHEAAAHVQGPPAGTAPSPPERRHGRFGRFRIVRQLGVGGNGIVFLAVDPTLNREVALKLPRLDAVFDPRMERRFLKEARAAAALRHPHIVPVYEVGHIGAVRYIISGYCRGPNLAQWLRQRKEQGRAVDPRLAAQWLVDLARAVHYAHSQGIVHRDLKPGNVLLEPAPAATSGDTPTVAYVPQLTDFGIAKWLDEDSDATKTGSTIGTLAYMSPEQARGLRKSIGPATDVYGLGAILYELLTGRAPFVASSEGETLKCIEGEEPVRPAQLVSSIPREVESICLKCLEKRPQDRYATADELAQDLERYLQDLPTLARPLGAAGRLWKWSRRNPAQAVMLVALALGLLAIASAGWWYSTNLQSALSTAQRANEQADTDRRDALVSGLEAVRARGQAEQLARGLRARVYPSDVRLAQQALSLGEQARAKRLLESYLLMSEDDLRDFAWYYLWSICNAEFSTLGTRHGEVYDVGYAPAGDLIVTAGKDGALRFWDPRDGRLKRTWQAHSSCINALDYTADGRRIVTGSCDRTLAAWDARTGDLLRRFDNKGAKVSSVKFTPDGNQVVSGDFENTGLRSWDVESGTLVAEFDNPTGSENLGAVGFLDAEGQRLVSSAGDALRVHDFANGLAELQCFGTRQTLRSAALSPDKQWIARASSVPAAIAGAGLDIELLRLDDEGQAVPAKRLTGIRAPIFALTFSGDGRLLASGSDSGVVRLWDVDTASLRATFTGHSARVTALRFSSDGSRLWSASADGTVKCWFLQTAIQIVHLPVSIAVEETTPRLAFTADNARLVLAGRDGLQAWNTADWSNHPSSHSPTWKYPNALACIADPQRQDSCLIAHVHDSQLSVWDAWSDTPRHTAATPPGDQIALAQDGRRLAASHWDDIALWNVQRFAVERRLPGISAVRPTPPLALSADGRWLAAADGGTSDMFVWDLQRKTEDRARLLGHSLLVDRLVFSTDGRLLASASRDGTARVWDVETGEERATFFDHAGAVRAIAFAPDQRSIATGADDGTIHVWDPRTGIELLELPEYAPGRVLDLTFSPRSDLLAALVQRADGLCVVTIWSAPRS